MKFLIPAIIGSIIGYFTNWIAIRMLFRPYTEKRIFGFKIPFTPGLIPKERYRVARSVGDTVGNYLLTKEQFEQLLKEEKTSNALKHLLISKRDSYSGKDKKIKEVLNKYTSINDEYIYNMCKEIINKSISSIEKDENKIKLMNFLESIYDDVSIYITKNVEDNSINYIKDILENKNINEYLYFLIKNSNNNKTINDILKDEYKEEINRIIENNEDKIIKYSRDILYKEEIKRSISNSVLSVIQMNVSPLITTFISKESINTKVINAIYNFIDGEDFSILIKEIIENAKLEIYKININSVKDSFIKEVNKDTFDKVFFDIADSLLRIYDDKNLNKKISLLLSSELKKLRVNSIYKSYKYIMDFINDDSTKEKLYLFLYNKVNGLLDKDITFITEKITDEKVESLVDKLFNYLNDTDYEIIINILNVVNIPKIVEDQINSFELDFAEKLILDIAGKELKAITNLGALIGAIIGLLNPLIQMIQI